MLRYEGMGILIAAVITYPQNWLAWTLFIVPRTLFCITMQSVAFQADRLVPFAQGCVRNIRLAKQQMLPVLIHMKIQDYADVKRQVVVEQMTQGFYEGLKKILGMFFPLIYTEIGRELPKLFSKALPKVLPKVLPKMLPLSLIHI